MQKSKYAVRALQYTALAAAAREERASHYKLCEKGQARASLLNIRRLITAWIMAWLLSHNRS
jgi:hypothetical protein